jgi:hypothetical protein
LKGETDTDDEVSKMKEIDRERLKHALQEVRGDYKEAVEKLGRERQEEFGADFSLGDFIAGACAIFSLTTEEDGPLPWPATSWVWAVLSGKNPLWPEGKAPEPDDPFRQQWLVIAMPPYATYLGRSAEVIASFDESQEAEWFANQCNELAADRSGDHYRYLRVQVPGRGYENRQEFADVWAKVEASEEEE